jgi:SSS family solute:Na+ symporter
MHYQGISGMLSQIYQSRQAGYIYFIGAFLFLVPYVSVQIRGVSIFLHAMFPDALPAWGWSVVVVMIMLAYSEVGGLRAIVYCDVFQGIVLLITIWIIAVGCIQKIGGVNELFQQVHNSKEALLSVPGPAGLFTTQFLAASFLAFLGVPLTQPQVVTRLIIVRSQKTMQLMAVGMGIFSFVILLATVFIGFYGALKYGDVPTRDFLAGVFLQEQADFIAALVVVGLLAAATSTADSQIFALGTELRSILLSHGVTPLVYTRAAVLFFGMAAMLFSILSSDQLVLLARVSFTGTALMAPMVLAAIYSNEKPSRHIVTATAGAIVLFLLSLMRLIPAAIAGFRMDLMLLIAVSCFTLIAVHLQKEKL